MIYKGLITYESFHLKKAISILETLLDDSSQYIISMLISQSSISKNELLKHFEHSDLNINIHLNYLQDIGVINTYIENGTNLVSLNSEILEQILNIVSNINNNIII